MMLQAYLVFRSVTSGQRALAALERSAIPCRLQRSPRQISEKGCAYALTVSEQNLNRSLGLLRQERILPTGVYLRSADGGFERASV